MGYQEPTFNIPFDPEPVQWQSKVASKRRAKEAATFEENEVDG